MDKHKNVSSTPLVSIGLAVYNVERYLRKSLESLLSQTLNDIEIIIVNDGSTDGSEAICREYAEKDERIVLISKENGGLASARQMALEVSTGRFFCTCDSDDWVESTMYERLYEKAIESNADIVMCDYWSEYPDGKKIRYSYSYRLEDRKDLLGDALNGKFPCQVWNKMFKRELFEKYDISWEPGINLGEDFLIMLKILQHPVKVEYLSETLYHYRREMGGASYTNNISLKTFQQSLFIRKWAVENIDTVKYSNGIFRLWLNLAFTGLRVKDDMSTEYYNNEVMFNLPYTGFLKYKYPISKGGLVLLTKLFGYNTGKSIYKILYKYVYS